MILTAPYRDKNPRLAIAAGIVGAGLLILLAALFRVQVLDNQHYDNREEVQSLRRIRIPSARGEIVDRNGVVLANNRPSYDIAISLDQLRVSKRDDVVRIAEANLFSLSRKLGLTLTKTDRDFRNHYLKRRPIPMPIWSDQKTEVVAAFAERAGDVPGTDLIVTPVRQYPFGTLAAHLLGYCGRAEKNEEDELEHFYYYEADSEGRQGVERSFNEYLRGAPGGRTIRVNPGGIKVGDVGEKEAERGDRVTLTIDVRIQKIVEAALQSATPAAGAELAGAAVVLDPRNGEVLALASFPTFDPNNFVPGAPSGAINASLQGTLRPMWNRVLGAGYAPGSTFKPITLLAGLEAGTIDIHDEQICPGYLQIGNRRFNCHNDKGHGKLDAMGAMAHSCDVWFYKEGMKTGVDAISRMANELGLGSPTGIDFGAERQGLVPTPAWKRNHQGEAWFDGDTAQYSIGQSFLAVTPLQMANMAATFANGGTRWQPFIVKRITESHDVVVENKHPRVASRLSAKPGNIEIVRQAMLGVITSGTGIGASVKDLKVAGKTGTAEYNKKLHHSNRAWFIGFAPYDQPTIALAVVIEAGESGSHTAAPVAQKILAGIFQKNIEPVKGEIGVD